MIVGDATKRFASRRISARPASSARAHTHGNAHTNNPRHNIGEIWRAAHRTKPPPIHSIDARTQLAVAVIGTATQSAAARARSPRLKSPCHAPQPHKRVAPVTHARAYARQRACAEHQHSARTSLCRDLCARASARVARASAAPCACNAAGICRAASATHRSFETFERTADKTADAIARAAQRVRGLHSNALSKLRTTGSLPTPRSSSASSLASSTSSSSSSSSSSPPSPSSSLLS